MRVVVSGATGLIGSALVSALRARGDEAVRLVRGDPGGGDLSWDPARARCDSAGLEGIDGVVHLAGELIAPPLTSGKRQRVLASRKDGTRLLAETLARLHRPPSVMVSASAIGFYGDRGEESLTESSGQGSGFLADVVEQWEEAADPARAAGIRVVHPRSGLVMSGRGGALRRLAVPFRLGLGGRLGSGRQWWSWISLTDEVGAILHGLDHGELSGPVNLTAPNPVRNEEFTRALGEALHRPTVIAVPAAALRAALGRTFADDALLASQRVIPERLLDTGYGFRHTEVRQALAAEL